MQNYKSTYIVTILTFLCLIAQGQGISPSPLPLTIYNANNELTIVGRGSAQNPITITHQKHLVVQKNDAGIYVFVTLNEDEITPSTVIASNCYLNTNATTHFLNYNDYPENTIQLKNSERLDASIYKSMESKGDMNMLCILIDFTSTSAQYNTTQIGELFNADYNTKHSVSSFYKTSSNNQLKLTFDCTDWMTIDEPISNFGGVPGNTNHLDLAAKAFELAEANGVDFSQYDNDGDGVVDGVIIMHAGRGGEEGSDDSFPWSHRGQLTGTQVKNYDGVKVADYVLVAETRSSTNLAGIGTICHEIAHLMGLLDLYSLTGTSSGIGKWGMMAAGSWGANGSNSSEHYPTDFCAFSKDHLEWITPDVYQEDTSCTITLSTGSTVKIPLPTSYDSWMKDEYFLIENRQQTGLDIGLPGHGMAIWHVDNNRWSYGQSEASHKVCDLEEASGSQTLDSPGNGGSQANLFPGSSNATSFNSTSSPNSLTYDGYSNYLTISNITEVDGIITFDLNTAQLTVADTLKGDIVFTSQDEIDNFPKEYKYISGKLSISTANTGTIENTDGLNHIISVDELEIRSETIETVSFGALTTINKSCDINSCNRLTDISFPSLLNVGEDLILYMNTKIINVGTWNENLLIDGKFYFYYNVSLRQYSDLSSLMLTNWDNGKGNIVNYNGYDPRKIHLENGQSAAYDIVTTTDNSSLGTLQLYSDSTTSGVFGSYYYKDSKIIVTVPAVPYGTLHHNGVQIYTAPGESFEIDSINSDHTISIKYNNIPTEVIEKEITALSIYPNPSDDYITITGLVSNATVTIIDMTGRTMMTQNITPNKKISTTNLKGGVYMLHIQNKDIDQIIRIMVK